MRSAPDYEEKQNMGKYVRPPNLQCQLPAVLLITTVSVGLLPVRTWSEGNDAPLRRVGGLARSSRMGYLPCYAIESEEAQDAVETEAGEAYTDLDLVFPNPDGAPWPPDSFSVRFGKLARTAECVGFRLHDLRHAFATATLTLADGVSIGEVSDLLGHSSKSLTLSTYAHAMPGGGQAAVTNLARSLLGAEVAASP